MNESMATYILVHGAWRNNRVWEDIVPLLEVKNHQVIVPNLPGHDIVTTLLKPVTMEDYVESIVAIVQKQNEKVILVGHSMAGMVISLVAEQIPDKVAKLVYVCAFLPQNGESINDLAFSQENLYLQLEISENGELATLQEDSVYFALYNNCNRSIVNEELKYFVPQFLNVFETKAVLSDKKFGTVPKIYIECTKDCAIGITLQKRMVSQQACDKVFTIDTDHAPFLSTPELLGKILLAL